MRNSIFQKEMCLNEKIAPTQMILWSKKCRVRLMRLASIKKTSQDEEQNQTTIITNIKYNRNFMSILKRIIKVKIASDNSDNKHNNLYFTRKEIGLLHIKATLR